MCVGLFPLQDAAWASFALLRNSNICGLVALWEGRAVMCRGLVGLPQGTQAAAAGGDADAVLAALSQVGWPSHVELGHVLQGLLVCTPLPA
jgi:hypothetical protein